MPGEISRSNPGPRANTPLVPSWICDIKPDHELDVTGTVCKICGMLKESFGRYRKPPSRGGEGR